MAKKKIKKTIKKKSAIKKTSTLKTKPSKFKVVKPEVMLPTLRTPHTESSPVVADPLVRYMTEIRKYPLLTKEEEHRLAVRFKKTGDPLAAEKLVTSNLRFVVKIAAEYAKMGSRMMDLIQEGNVGLMHAVKEFNPYKGVRLITYAVWWIRGFMREYMLRSHSMVRIGTTQAQKKLFYQLEKEVQNLESMGKSAETALISQRLDVPMKDVETMRMRMKSRDVSLDQPMGDDDSTSSLMDLQANAETVDSPETSLEMNELLDILKEKVDEIRPTLNEKELIILENRILAEEPMTLQEVGDKFGITRERARQIEFRLIKNLKESFFKEDK